jgi:Na+/phosphate symporter
MVAMGTSLADRAWGRDTAVYRIAGVLNVIGGWLMTAVVAFLVSGLFALSMNLLGLTAIIVLVSAAIFVIANTYRIHRKNLQRKNERDNIEKETSSLTQETMEGRLGQSIIDVISRVESVVRKSVIGMVNQKRKKLKKALKAYDKLKNAHEDLNDQLFSSIKKTQNVDKKLTKDYVLSFDLEQDILQSAFLIVNECFIHVENSHEPYNEEQANRLLSLTKEVSTHLKFIKAQLSNGDPSLHLRADKEKSRMTNLINEHLQKHIERIQTGEFNEKNGALYLTLILEMKDLIHGASNLGMLFPKGTKATFIEPELEIDEAD